jgi:hypothetical protein
MGRRGVGAYLKLLLECALCEHYARESRHKVGGELSHFGRVHPNVSTEKIPQESICDL